jgi:hypothetical protein
MSYMDMEVASPEASAYVAELEKLRGTSDTWFTDNVSKSAFASLIEHCYFDEPAFRAALAGLEKIANNVAMSELEKVSLAKVLLIRPEELSELKEADILLQKAKEHLLPHVDHTEQTS